jgi:hypothetical protein
MVKARPRCGQDDGRGGCLVTILFYPTWPLNLTEAARLQGLTYAGMYGRVRTGGLESRRSGRSIMVLRDPDSTGSTELGEHKSS